MEEYEWEALLKDYLKKFEIFARHVNIMTAYEKATIGKEIDKMKESVLGAAVTVDFYKRKDKK